MLRSSSATHLSMIIVYHADPADKSSILLCENNIMANKKANSKQQKMTKDLLPRVKQGIYINIAQLSILNISLSREFSTHLIHMWYSVCTAFEMVDGPSALQEGHEIQQPRYFDIYVGNIYEDFYVNVGILLLYIDIIKLLRHDIMVPQRILYLKYCIVLCHLPYSYSG